MNNLVYSYQYGDKELILKTDVAASNPIYIYFYGGEYELLYSNDIVALLNHERVQKPLAVSESGISMLLKYGAIISPKTIYKNIFLISIGDSARVYSEEKIKLEFSYNKPFQDTYLSKQQKNDNIANLRNKLYRLISNSVVSSSNKNQPTYLFHSAGKDSNIIALALAKCGLQNRVTLVTLKTIHKSDESDISRTVACKLGFKHIKLNEPVHKWHIREKELIRNYFINAPFPLTDYVGLLYPLYLIDAPEFASANIIDGGVNDIYMKLPVDRRSKFLVSLSRFLEPIVSLRRFFKASLVDRLLKFDIERFFGSGLKVADCKLIFPSYKDSYKTMMYQSNVLRPCNVIDMKTIMVGRLALTQHILKAKNFGDVFGAKIILPFLDSKVVNHITSFPAKMLLDEKNGKNKPIFREILNDELGINSDAVGKRGYSFSVDLLLENNSTFIENEIKQCPFWDAVGIEDWLQSNKAKRFSLKNKVKWIANMHFMRLFLISSWLTHQKHIRLSD